MPVDTSAALRKLTSGATLTNEERQALGMAPVTTPTTGAVLNFTPTVTMGANTSGLFVGPIPTGTTRTATGYTTTPAAPATQFPAAGTFLGWDYVGQTSTTGTLRRKILADGKGGQKIDMATEKNPDYVSGSRGGGTGGGTGGTGTGTGTGLTQADIDAALAKANAAWQSKYDALANQQKEANRANVTTALDDFRASLKLAGLDTLVDTIDSYIKQDLTAAQIKINLVGTQAYKDRFPGMETLSKAGRAINEATYISMERGYEQVLRAYGIDTSVFGSRAQLGKYISNEVSPVEFENRVQIAADRVNKNADVTSMLQEYYGVSKGGAIAYLLDPTLGMDIVKKEARAAEIGAAAVAAGFGEFAGKANVGVAESFVNASGTQDLQSLKTEFGKARNLANVQERLTVIEGGQYQDVDAVTAILGQDQQKLLESQRRAQREQARFAGGSGVSTQSLRSNTNNI